MNDDMSSIMQNLSKMMNGNQEIPDNIKNILNSMNNGNNQTNENTTNHTNTTVSNDNNSNDQNSSTNRSNAFENFDINTFFKMQQIMNSLNDKQNDSRTNLLLSLKPYLKESRKNKVDQYIQLMKMGKIIEIMNPLGGDKNNVN